MPNHDPQENPAPDPDRPRYRSFLLRCYRKANGDIHTRLMDVQTGQTYHAARQTDIYQIIEDLFAKEIKAETEDER